MSGEPPASTLPRCTGASGVEDPHPGHPHPDLPPPAGEGEEALLPFQMELEKREGAVIDAALAYVAAEWAWVRADQENDREKRTAFVTAHAALRAKCDALQAFYNENGK